MAQEWSWHMVLLRKVHSVSPLKSRSQLLQMSRMYRIRVILVNMEISVILGHEKTKIQNILDLGKIDVFSVRTNIYIKNKKMGHLI